MRLWEEWHECGGEVEVSMFGGSELSKLPLHGVVLTNLTLLICG